MPHKDKEIQKQWKRLYRQQLKAKGICMRCCKQPCERDKTICARCSQQHSINDKRRRTKLKEQGVCRCKSRVEEGKTRCTACLQQQSESVRTRYNKLREEVYNAYGTKCACCGEDTPEFLTIDHINEDGASHRKSIAPTRKCTSEELYRWLKNNNYPSGFQTLCQNCNVGKFRNGGICPHKVHNRHL